MTSNVTPENITTRIPLTLTTVTEGLQVFGYPGFVFYLIHLTAITSLSCSIVASGGAIIYFFTSCQGKTVWRRPIGERLALYLALSDFMFSNVHVLDHVYMLAVVDHPPDRFCTALGFLVQMFILVQMLVVLFTALSTCMLVLGQKKINLGAYDWRLIAYALGLPLLNGVIGVVLGLWGPSGAW